MCSEYTNKTSINEIHDALGVTLLNTTNETKWDQVVKFSMSVPVIEIANGKPTLSLKIFPVSPMPNSRLSGVGNQTDGDDKNVNDEIQIKRIYEMPWWKRGFSEFPIVIPMTSFREFAYWGPEKGTAQDFKLPKETVFFAAGILIKPFVPKGEANSAFSMLTHTATEQMLKYHHRLVVILEGKYAIQYLNKMPPQERFDFLLKHRYTGHLLTEKIRDMGKGWTKRVDHQESKLHKEMQYRSVLEKENVEG